MTTEVLPTAEVHRMCDAAERAIRAMIIDPVTKADLPELIHEMALAKFYTWETAVQDPEMCDGWMELDWEQVSYFEETLQRRDVLYLVQDLCNLMPGYVSWIRFFYNEEDRPLDFEIWRRFALTE